MGYAITHNPFIFIIRICPHSVPTKLILPIGNQQGSLNSSNSSKIYLTHKTAIHYISPKKKRNLIRADIRSARDTNQWNAWMRIVETLGIGPMRDRVRVPQQALAC